MKSVGHQEGFGLVQVLVVTALVSIMVLALSSLVTNMNKELSLFSTKNEISNLQTQVESVFQRSATCIHNLTTLNSVSFGGTPNFNLTRLNQESGIGVYASTIIPGLNVPISPGSRLQISSMNLTNHGAMTTPTPAVVTATTKLYLMDFRLSFASVDGDVSRKPLVIETVRVETDLSDAIQTCELIPPGNMSEICADLGLNWDASASDCMGTETQLCAALSGTIDSTGKCITTVQNGGCGSSSFITGFDDRDQPRCASLSIQGIWSDWTPCPGPDPATQSRSCIVGTCTGPTTRVCPPP